MSSIHVRNRKKRKQCKIAYLLKNKVIRDTEAKIGALLVTKFFKKLKKQREEIKITFECFKTYFPTEHFLPTILEPSHILLISKSCNGVFFSFPSFNLFFSFKKHQRVLP